METRVFKFGDILDNYDYLRKPLSSMERENFQGPYPYYGAQGIIDYVQDYRCDGQFLLIAEDGENLMSRSQPIAIIACGKYWVNNHAHIVKTKDIADIHYICYAINHLDITGYVTGSAQPKLSQGNLNKIKMQMPSIDNQKKIVSILAPYDDLIEINNKRIKTLEQMAENLYKEWFVRFRFPGNETAEFENGIPKDWEIRKCSEIALIKAGGDRPDVFSKEYNEENPIPIYSNGIDNDGLYGYTNTPEITNESITISARGTVGFVCLRRKPYVPIVRLISVEPNLNMVTPVYLYYFFRRDTVMGNGTSQQQITIPMVSKKRVLLPPIKLVQLFSIKVNTFFDQIDCLKKKNHNLFKQRDLLLPRLMSGKLEV